MENTGTGAWEGVMKSYYRFQSDVEAGNVQ